MNFVIQENIKIRLICVFYQLYLRRFSMAKKITSLNPFTGKVNKEFDPLTEDQLKEKIKRAEQAFKVQTKRTVEQRAQLVGKLGKVFKERERTIAEMITTEMGKPITQSLDQVRKVIKFCEHYSKHYDPIRPVDLQTEAKKKAQVKYKPLGILYLIVPYNFPFFLNFKAGLPNLVLGNVLLAKNSSVNPMLGELIEELVKQAGFDSGQYQNVFSTHDHMDLILSQDSVVGVSFTGSSQAGAKVAQVAGKHIKKSVMELGGNDPFIVLEDADIDKAIQDAVEGRNKNAGQTCFAPKRFIIAEKHYNKFKTGLIDNLQKIKHGDPMDEKTEIGPLAKSSLIQDLQKQIKQIPSSWKVIYKKQEMKAPFFPLTVIEGSDETYDVQLFGPVFSIFKAKDQAHAIDLANKGNYGLSASVYSAERGQEVMDQIRCGMGFINQPAQSHYSFPTGGVANSGYGRQCWTEGFRSFANIKLYYQS